MSHNVGHVISIAAIRTGPDSGAAPVGGAWESTFTPQPADTGGSPRFVILHLTSMDLPATNRVEINVGYDIDTFTAADGPDVWTRPIDPNAGPIKIRYIGSGPTGGVTLAEYGSGEPTFTDYPAGQEWLESTTNADVFLHTDPYAEPTYQTWLRCGGTYDWQNVSCVAGNAIQTETARAVGMIVAVHSELNGDRHVSTCSGTLIDSNLFLTARHCLTDANDLEIRSGSVTFDFQTTCAGGRPPGYAPKFYKIRRAVAAGASPTTYDTTTDWLILEVDPTPPASIVPRPLRAAAPVVGEQVFTIHHPNGTVKKTQSGTLSGNTVTSVTGFDYGGGSSGSALFDAQGRVIGAALSSGGSGPNQCTVGYCPVTSVIDALANPPAPPTPYDVMLVIDRSGSMTGPGTSGPGRTKMDEAKEAASLFVQLVQSNAGHRMGMVSFSTTASNPVDEAAGNVNSGQKQQLVGNAPYTGGKVGALVANGATSIGDGLQLAAQAFPGGANQKAIVLMTDGMQNTPPMVENVEPQLAGTKVAVIGFGSDAQLDGALLTRLAQDHAGMYTRANDGLALKKFYALCFGNIFEAGMLADPEAVLDSGVAEAKPMAFEVFDEDTITAVVAWDSPGVSLEAVLHAPDGSVVDESSAGVIVDRGATWWFLRVPLSVSGQREGTWELTVRRPGYGDDVELSVARWPRVRYQASVLADGGPRLVPLPPDRPLYTGDPITPRVALQYATGVAPYGEVTLRVDRPNASLGQLVQEVGLGKPGVGDEVVPAFAVTLQQLERDNGGILPIARSTTSMPLYDDGFHDDGAMERDGIFADPVDDLLRHEGTYTFHALAQYGEGRRGRREAMWSVTVLPGIDGGRTDVAVQPTGDGAGTLVVRPRDRYGNPLGPGRGDLFGVDPLPGTQVTGPVMDNGDGTYGVPVAWEPGTEPGISVAQPGRPAVPLTPTGSGAEPGGGMPQGCLLWLLMALGLTTLVLAIALLIALLD